MREFVLFAGVVYLIYFVVYSVITVCHSILIRMMMATSRKHKAQPYGGVTCFQKKG